MLVNNPVELSSIESISLHGVMPEWPLLVHPPKQAVVEVAIPEEHLDKYEGTYRIDPEDSGLPYTLLARFRREGDGLVVVQSPPNIEFELGALSQTEFFARGSEVRRYRFSTNENRGFAEVTMIRPPSNPITLVRVVETP